MPAGQPTDDQTLSTSDPTRLPDGETDGPLRSTVDAEATPTLSIGRTPRTARRLRRRRLVVGGAAAVAVVVAGVVLLLSRGSPQPRPSTTAPAAAPSPRTPFAFAPPKVIVISSGKKGTAIGRQAASQVTAALSALYDQAFMDPNTWKKGLPAAAWASFDPSVVSSARADSASFFLSTPPPGLTTLAVTDASLIVHVLLDPSGKAFAATAAVSFGAQGTLKDGGSVTVTNHAQFVFRSGSGRWLIVAYPKARTTVDTAPPAPVGGASIATPTAGASP